MNSPRQGWSRDEVRDLNDPDVLNKIGYALTRMGKFDEAIAHFNQALKIDPTHATVKKNLAAVLAERQKSQNTGDTLP